MGTMSKEEILKILEDAKDKNSDVPMRLVRQAFEKLPEPCEDTVSRQWLLDEYDKRHKGQAGGARKIIEEAPSAQPERKRGKWIYKNDLKQFFCSECGFPSLTYDDTYLYGMDLPNYCEECGADMRGEQDE